ncbi:hypothetical protein EYC84_008783 [Monilinia fructicola]|uniref:Uncharacterized protein n=1 Tax=Monilinia fructicola TaxID=38448 RepID=A0A5M9JAA7_MONFR|nr:hypothetical protein EYC84_008783 [Monilinia fructicola]
MASEDMKPRLDQDKILPSPGTQEQEQSSSPESNSEGGVALASSPVGAKQKCSKRLPPLKTTGLTQNDRQHLALLGSEKELERLFGEEVSEIENPDDLSCMDITPNNPRMIHGGHGDVGSYSSEDENDGERISTASREQDLENEFPNEELRDERVILGIRCIDDSRDALESGDCIASIRAPSTEVSSLVLEAGGSPSISPLLSCRSDASSPNMEIRGEVNSFKETELCASRLEQHVTDEIHSGPARDSAEVSSNCRAHMKDRLDIASLEGISSNCGNTASFLVTSGRVDPIIDNDDDVRPCSNVSVDGSAETSEEIDENLSYIQGGVISSSEHRVSQSEPGISDVENDDALLDRKENVASGEPEGEWEIACSEGFSPAHQLGTLYKTTEDCIRGVCDTEDPIPLTAGGDISNPRENLDSCEIENEREIESSERFSPVHQRVLSSMTPKHSIRFASRDIDGELSTSSHARIMSSVGADHAERFGGDEREEKLIGGGCREAEGGISLLQPEDFWVKTSGEKQTSATEIQDEEIAINEEEQQYRLEMGRRMKRKNPGLLGPQIDGRGEVVMEISRAGLDNVGTIHRSIPQVDGPGSPPLLTVDSPVERAWSPSPRKKLQKVNRSKSPTSMKQSSSSSLGKIFQSSRVEGLEGEIRDLRSQVGELKRVIDGLEKESKEVKVKGGEEYEMLEQMEQMGVKMKEVWRTLYGKGWDGERLGEEGQDWKDVDEVEYTRKVRDVGLLRVVGRLKMEVDRQRKEKDEDRSICEKRGIGKYEMDWMLPHPTEFDFNGRDNGNGNGISRWKGKWWMGMPIPISSEDQEGAGLGIGGGLKSDDLILAKHLGSVALMVSDPLNLEEEQLEAKQEDSERQCESRSMGDGKRLEVEHMDTRTSFEREMGFGHEDESNRWKGDEAFVDHHEGFTMPAGVCQKMREVSDDDEVGDRAKNQHPTDDEQQLTGKSRWEDRSDGGKAALGEVGTKEGDERELNRLGGGFDEGYKESVDVKYGDGDGEMIGPEEVFEDFLSGVEGKRKGKGDERGDEKQEIDIKRFEDDVLHKWIYGFIQKGSDGRISSWVPDEKEARELIEARGIHLTDSPLGKGGHREKRKREKEREEESRVEYLMRCALEKQEVEKVRMEQWWEIERARDLEEIRRLGGEVEELRGLLLKGLEGGRGQVGGKASSIANMRARDVCGDGDTEDGGVGNGKGFWDWVGGGILWRQD